MAQQKIKRSENGVNLIFTAILVVLIPMTDFKWGNVKLAEIYAIFFAVLFAGPVFYRGLQERKIANFYRSILAWIGFVLATALISNQDFSYIPNIEYGFSQKPFVISFSRSLQIIIAVTISFFIFDFCQKSPTNLGIILSIYNGIGLFSVVFGVCGYLALSRWGIDNWAAYTTAGGVTRASSFFGEGGPWGSYLCSVLLTHRLVFQTNKTRLVYRVIVYAILGLGLFLSQSKAGLIVASFCIGIGYVFSTSHATDNTLPKTVFAAVAASTALVFVVFFSGITNYFYEFINLTDSWEVKSTSTALIMGRIAGMVIVPQMILSNPFFGIGIGNYPLLRNDPEYSSFLIQVDDWDLDGLGLVGLTAETGLVGVCIFYISCLESYGT